MVASVALRRTAKEDVLGMRFLVARRKVMSLIRNGMVLVFVDLDMALGFVLLVLSPA